MPGLTVNRTSEFFPSSVSKFCGFSSDSAKTECYSANCVIDSAKLPWDFAETQDYSAELPNHSAKPQISS
jgi:hypothetical protein